MPLSLTASPSPVEVMAVHNLPAGWPTAGQQVVPHTQPVVLTGGQDLRRQQQQVEQQQQHTRSVDNYVLTKGPGKGAVVQDST